MYFLKGSWYVRGGVGLWRQLTTSDVEFTFLISSDSSRNRVEEGRWHNNTARASAVSSLSRHYGQKDEDKVRNYVRTTYDTAADR
jgi:hypothetical protein